MLRVQGNIPGRECPQFSTHEFQVRVSLDGGATEQAILHPASLDWMTLEAPCIGLTTPYSSDPDGWFTLTAYDRLVACPNDESLAIWDSATDFPRDDERGVGLAELRLVLRPIGGGIEESSRSVKVQIDNNRPENVTMALYKPGETEQIHA